MRLVLLSRSYCHLCDEMAAALASLIGQTALDVVDIDAPEHALLEALYGDAVPVLFAGTPKTGRELCRYRLDRERVMTALAEATEIR